MNLSLRALYNTVLLCIVFTAMRAFGYEMDWPSFCAGIVYLTFTARLRAGA